MGHSFYSNVEKLKTTGGGSKCLGQSTINLSHALSFGAREKISIMACDLLFFLEKIVKNNICVCEKYGPN